MNYAKTVSSALLLGLVLSAVTGCGGGGAALGEVSGIVTVDGQPAAGLEVRFDPEASDAGSSLGHTGADGAYELMYGGVAGGKGAAVGRHTVSVTATEMEDGGIAVAIPARYNQASELTFEVKAGTNPYNIEITTD